MQIHSCKTITDLSLLDGRVYVYLSSDELGRQFMQQAETEGFVFVNGTKPTKRTPAEIMALNSNHTINYVGVIGRIAYGARATMMNGMPLIRISYQEWHDVTKKLHNN